MQFGCYVQVAKEEIDKQINDFLEDYDSNFDLDEDEAAIFNEFLNSLYGNFLDADEDNKDEKNKDALVPIPLFPLSLKDLLDEEKEEQEEDVVAFTYQNKKSYISLSCLDGELYILDDDECEVLLTEDQMEFLVEAYHKIKKCNENNNKDERG